MNYYFLLNIPLSLLHKPWHYDCRIMTFLKSKMPQFAWAQRSGMKIDLYRNEPWTPINSGNELDPRLPQKPNFSTLGSRTALAVFQKTSKNSHISVVVAPIGLKFCVCA